MNVYVYRKNRDTVYVETIQTQKSTGECLDEGAVKGIFYTGRLGERRKP